MYFFFLNPREDILSKKPDNNKPKKAKNKTCFPSVIYFYLEDFLPDSKSNSNSFAIQTEKTKTPPFHNGKFN